ncbi:MAG TPA: YciI family protein [Thermomicrobiales bacterium]|nr:YciI family protein [Thermomicrobiales bacterium]
MAVFAVTTAKGPNWDPARGIRDQQGWDRHAAFADSLVERGVIILGGPIASDSDEEVALLAVNAADGQELRSVFGDDPWARSGVLRIKAVRPWTLWLDGRAAGPDRA